MRNTLLEKYKNNEIVVWNKGLTKETSEQVKKIGKINQEKMKDNIPWNKGKHYISNRKNFKHTEETKRKLRLINLRENQSKETLKKRRESKIRYIEKTKNAGLPLIPTIGRCENTILNNFENILNAKILRQYRVEGYFLDGYCSIYNIAFEIDESHHFVNGQLCKYDIERENNIKKYLNCGFIRIKV